MKFKGAKINELGRLSALCRDDMATSTKIGLLSFQEDKIHPVFEILILLIEYFQLVSQALLTRKNSDNTEDTDTRLSGGVIFVSRVFNPGFWMTFDSESDLVFTVLAVAMIYTLIKFLLFGYIILVAYKDIPQYPILIGLWKWNFKLQGRVICFVLTSFWLQAILATLDSDFDIFRIGKAGTIALFMTLLLVEYIFSFFLCTQYCLIVPTKSLLSSKGYHTEVITLFQKFVIQMIHVLVVGYTVDGSNIVYALVNILFCIVRNVHYFVTFPLYNLKVLLFEAFLLMMVNSLDFACLFQIITKSLDFQNEVEFIAMVWIILTLLTTKIAYEYLLKIRLNLITRNSKVSPSLLVHKVIAIKQLRKQKRVPGEFSDKSEYAYLLNMAVDAGLESVFNFDLKRLKTENPTLTSKGSANELFANYLEGLLEKYPRNNFVKLYIAEFFAKKLKLYGIAMKLLTGLQNSHNSVISLNASILIWRIQSLIRTKGSMDEKQINLYIFFKTQMRYVELKKKMHRQNEAQMELYEEILNDSPDLMKVFEYGQLITHYRVNVERETNQMLADMPDYYIQPLLHCAHYHSILNNSFINYAKYYKLFTRKFHKFNKFFEIENLAPENYYQDGNAFALISGQKDDFGKIIFCTNSVSKIYGGDVNMYIGANITSLAPLSPQSFYSLFFENKTSNEQSELRGVFRGFTHHKEGHLVEVDFHLDVFPFLTQGFYFSLIMRPSQTQKEYIIIRENGDIEGATRRVGNQLHLVKHHSANVPMPAMNIKNISEELSHINHAYNIVAHAEKNGEGEHKDPAHVPVKNEKERESNVKYLRSTSSPQKKEKGHAGGIGDEIHIGPDLAYRLYNTFTQDGKNVQLMPVSKKEFRRLNTANTDDSKPLMYSCKMKVISQGSEAMKLIILDENKRANASSKFLASKVAASKNMESKNVESKSIRVSFDFGDGRAADNAQLFKKSSTIRSKKDKNLNLSDTKSENFGEMFEDDNQQGMSNEDGIVGPRTHYQPNAFFNGQEDMKTAVKTTDYQVTEGVLLSPLMSPAGMPLLSTGGNLLSPGGPAITMDIDHKQQEQQKIVNFGSRSTESFRDDDDDYDKEDKLDRLYDDVTSKASQKSRLSDRKQVARAFNLALNSKYYSKALRFLFIFCYLLLIGVFIGQVDVKVGLDNGISSLRVKKDLLRSSQKRDFALVGIHRGSRTVWDLGTGAIKSAQLGSFAYPVTTYINAVNQSIGNLTKTNQQVLTSAGNLEDSARDKLFLTDVKVFYDGRIGNLPNYTYLTNFQAGDSISQIGMKALVCAKATPTNVTKCKSGFDFIFKNCMNDMLLKSEGVSSLLLQAIQDEIQSKRDRLAYMLAVRLLLLFIICFSLTWIITKQYIKEKINMLALTRLDSKGIKEALDRLNIFKTSLETGDNIEGRAHKKIIQSAKKAYKTQVGRKKEKKKNIQSPDHSGILKRYLWFIARSLVCILILSGFAIWSSISASSSIEFLKSEQSKLYFADNMATRTNFAFLAAFELFASNDTTLLRNELVLGQLKKSLDDVASLKNSVMDVFLDGSEVDPNVQTTLLVEGCQFLNTSSATFCKFIKSKARKTNLVTMLSDYEAFIQDKYDNWFVSNKTSASLRYYQTSNYDIMLSLQRTIGDQSTYIGIRINNIFEAKFSNVKVQGNIAFSICIVALVIVSVLLWVLVFTQLREGINKFKNVLQAIPPSLILSNFVLKTFLIHTSKGLLDSSKTDM